MSYIKNMVEKYSHEKKEYSICELEQEIADAIINEAQRYIEGAIRQGRSCICMEYYHNNDGGSNIRYMDHTIEYYLNNDALNYLYGLGEVISVLQHDKTNLRNAIYANERKLNLANIEKNIQSGLINLGAQKAVAYVRFCEYVFITDRQKGPFGIYHDVKKQKPLDKYKICYTVSW